MVVTVHLHTAIRKRPPTGTDSPVTLKLPAGSCVQDILDQLDITFPTDGLLLVVNRNTVIPGQALKGGDVVHLIPAISGGGV